MGVARVESQVPTHRPRQPTAQCESEPDTGCTLGRLPIGLGEGLKETPAIATRQTRAAILNCDDRLPPGTTQLQAHQLAVARLLDGVVEQIGEYLLDRGRVDPNRELLCFVADIELDAQTRTLGLLPQRLDLTLQKGAQPKRLDGSACAPRLHACIEQDVLHQVREALA